jgi:hypothetical protein
MFPKRASQANDPNIYASSPAETQQTKAIKLTMGQDEDSQAASLPGDLLEDILAVSRRAA